MKRILIKIHDQSINLRNCFHIKWSKKSQLITKEDFLSRKQWEFDKTHQDAREILFSKMGIQFNIKNESNDEWGYIFLNTEKNIFSNFCWDFNFTKRTDFREFAFNFRYIDFDNRYRYRFERGRIYFDKKVRGEWVNNISSNSCFIALEKSYKVSIWAKAHKFRCYVNDRLMMQNEDLDLSNGSICVILWETDSKTDIVASIDSMEITSL